MQPGDRYFSLEFLSTDYRSPKDNYYSFYLEGYETTWNQPRRHNNLVRYEDGRLHKALELLKSTDLQISEIAYDVGFSDPSYFTRMFRQEFGKAPGEVR